MRTSGIALAVLAFAAAGCGSLGAPERLIADLQVRGLPAAMGTEFDAALLGGEGRVVCVGRESVQVYEFSDGEAAGDAAATVNRNDPSNVGNGIVEWIGPPRFWLRDEAIVIYVGGDAGVDAALRTILGQPFAEQPDFQGRALPEHLQRDCELAR